MWPLLASQLLWKVLFPAPCPCPTASRPWPTHRTLLLLARLSSLRRIEIIRVTSCSCEELSSLGAWWRAPCALGPKCAEVASSVGLGAPETDWACTRRGKRKHVPKSIVVVPFCGLAHCPVSFAFLVKQKKLVANSITNVLVCVQFLEHYKGFVCLAVHKKKT